MSTLDATHRDRHDFKAATLEWCEAADRGYPEPPNIGDPPSLARLMESALHWEVVTHTCGHTELHSATGSREVRQTMYEHWRHMPCPDCRPATGFTGAEVAA